MQNAKTSSYNNIFYVTINFLAAGLNYKACVLSLDNIYHITTGNSLREVNKGNIYYYNVIYFSRENIHTLKQES